MSLGFPSIPVFPLPLLVKKNYLQGMATIAQRFCLFNVLLPPGTETVTLPIASLQLPFAFSSCLLTVTFQTPWYSCLGDDKGWGLCSSCDADRHKCERIHPDSLGQAARAWLPVLGEHVPQLRVPSAEPPGILLTSASPWEMRVGLHLCGSSRGLWLGIIKGDCERKKGGASKRGCWL